MAPGLIDVSIEGAVTALKEKFKQASVERARTGFDKFLGFFKPRF